MLNEDQLHRAEHYMIIHHSAIKIDAINMPTAW